jgi:hypothetical protein
MNRARLLAWWRFYRDYYTLWRTSSGRLSLAWADRFPCLGEWTISAPVDHHYFYHPAWAMRVVLENPPRKHIDVGSILHFSAALSAVIPVESYDLRPARVKLHGLRCRAANLTALPFADDSVESISCMHAVEHVGLGRYGDAVDYDGDLQAMRELQRVVAKEGQLLFVVPVGRPRVCFNAHRIYSYDQVIHGFSGLKLKEFALISQGRLKRHADPALVAEESYGCGCFHFVKMAGA